MAKSYEVLAMLIPNGGYVQSGDSYEGIEFIDCEPITKAEYEAGFKAYDAWKAEQDSAKAEAKSAVYEKLGLTAEEVAALLA